jgi:hypothetical protein
VTRQEFVAGLVELGRRHGDIPIYGSAAWEALNNLDPRRLASIVRAAEAWRLDGEPAAVRARLLRHREEVLKEAERLAVDRLRQLSYDLAGATDWKALAAAWKPAGDWARLRVYDAPAPRQGQPWTADDLDRNKWRETKPPPPRWMFGPGPIRVTAEGGAAA